MTLTFINLAGGQVTIRIIASTTYIEISVEDDGVGIEAHILQHFFKKESTQQLGVGLLNTDQRLQRLFGEGLQINSTPGSGTIISFKVPYRNE